MPGVSDDDLSAAAAEIAAASDADQLVAACIRAHSVAGAITGVQVSGLARDWSTLCRTAVATAAASLGGPDQWLVSGSVGRGEALPGADLETLVVRADGTDPAAGLARASAVHELLSRCGFAADPHGAFAARARFNRSLDDWTAGIDRWTSEPEADRGVVMAGLLADAVAVSGGPELPDLVAGGPGVASAPPALVEPPDLRCRTGAAMRAHPQSLAAMLQDACYERAAVPSRLRIFGGASTADVKRAAVDPVVRIARWAAVSAGSDALTTPDRLAAAAGSRFLDAADAATLSRCYTIASSIRRRTRDLGEDGVLEMAALAPRDRTALRGIGREVTRIARTLNYLASTSAFSPW
ncbi:hypothetical protein BST26_06320 [Mycolicibacterium insubricum]|uniref:Uncharacterized protein n=1 Tax=Mycolicibacterium insubricum TaxID=444597 RepID=A0A1X0DIA4_9MYCO|nr:hypothetical protein BST26_06320 [Mycolicibacterium insubricum]